MFEAPFSANQSRIALWNALQEKHPKNVIVLLEQLTPTQFPENESHEIQPRGEIVEKFFLDLADRYRQNKKATPVKENLTALQDILKHKQISSFSEYEDTQLADMITIYSAILSELITDTSKTPANKRAPKVTVNLKNIARAEMQQVLSEALIRDEDSTVHANGKYSDHILKTIKTLYQKLDKEQGEQKFNGFYRGTLGHAATYEMLSKQTTEDGEPRLTILFPPPEEDANFETDLIAIDEVLLRQQEPAEQVRVREAINQALRPGRPQDTQSSFLSKLPKEYKPYIMLVQIKCVKTGKSSIGTMRDWETSKPDGDDSDDQKRNFFTWSQKNDVSKALYVVINEKQAKKIITDAKEGTQENMQENA